MSLNWLRSCSLVVSGPGGSKTVSGGGQTDLRIKFCIKMWHMQAPNMASFRVYNVSPATAALLKQNELVGNVEFFAGYESNIGVVFSGNIKQVISGHETAVDTYVDVFAADGEYAYNSGRVTKTLAAGYTPQDKVKAAVDAMGQYGVTMGTSTLDLSQPKYPRGTPLVGMARDIMRQVTLSAGGLWSIQLGKVKLTPKTLDSSSDAVTLSASTGLVGWPQQTQDGIFVRSLINPKLQPLMKIKLDPSQIIAAQKDNNPLTSPASNNQFLDQQALGAGTYTIFHMDRVGDTRAQDWYDESLCIGVGGTLGPGSVSQGYSTGPIIGKS